MKKTFLLLTLLFNPVAFPCEVTLPHQLVIMRSEESTAASLSSKGCDEAATTELYRTLSGLQGRISSAQLTELLAAKGHKLSVSPNVLHVQQLGNIIKDQLPIPPGVQIREIRASAATLELATSDRVEVVCADCAYGETQPLNLNIISFSGEERSVPVEVAFRKVVRSYRLTAPINSFSDVPVAALREEHVDAIPHTDLITDLSTLRFYRTNKPLKSGELLRKSDLGAINLVRAGVSTEVIMENELIKIKTSGISRSNGSLGDTVEVYQPQKNKKYQGKVVDINKVLIEL